MAAVGQWFSALADQEGHLRGCLTNTAARALCQANQVRVSWELDICICSNGSQAIPMCSLSLWVFAVKRWQWLCHRFVGLPGVQVFETLSVGDLVNVSPGEPLGSNWIGCQNLVLNSELCPLCAIRASPPYLPDSSSCTLHLFKKWKSVLTKKRSINLVTSEHLCHWWVAWR